MERHSQKNRGETKRNKINSAYQKRLGLERKEKLDKYHILNLGAGVNSTALLLYLMDHKLPLDEVIFADTGAEMPETYEYLPRIMKFCLDVGVKFTVVDSPLGSLQDLCLNEEIIPSRLSRWCTYKFKIRPIANHLKPKGKHVQYFGISSEEKQRANPKGRNKLAIRKFPLVESGINREGCINIIKAHGWPVPIKSGCFFCPFQSLKGWHHLYLNHPEKYAQAEALEKNNSKYPKFIFTTRPLSSLKNRFGDGTSKLEEWCYAPKCETGYCMT